jgi:Ribosome biogenesis protein SLX9
VTLKRRTWRESVKQKGQPKYFGPPLSSLKSLLLELPDEKDGQMSNRKGKDAVPSLIEKCLTGPVKAASKDKTSLITSLSLLKKDDKKKNPSLKEKQFFQSFKVTKPKKRLELMKLEAQQFMNVLQHPAFQKDPLETIQTHIKNVFSSNSCLNK